MSQFIQINDKDEGDTPFINIDQIAWFNVDVNTIMVSAPSDKGLFHTDEESIKKLIKCLRWRGEEIC